MDDVYNWGLGLINNFANGNFVIPNDWISAVQDSLGSILEVVKNLVYSFATGIINFAGQVPGAINTSSIDEFKLVNKTFDSDIIAEIKTASKEPIIKRSNSKKMARKSK